MILKKRGLSGTVSTDISRREIENGKVSRMAARESFVLLENNGVLPLKKGAKIGLYGGGAVKTMKGGTGSGDVNERRTVSVYEGLENVGYEITSKEPKHIVNFVRRGSRVRTPEGALGSPKLSFALV